MVFVLQAEAQRASAYKDKFRIVGLQAGYNYYPLVGSSNLILYMIFFSTSAVFLVIGRFVIYLGVTNTTQNQPHQISNTQRTENKTTDVVIQQHSRKLLMKDIFMSETC